MSWLNNMIIWAIATDLFDDEEEQNEDDIVISIEYD